MASAKKKSPPAGQAALQAYKEERFTEAVNLFTEYIKKNVGDKVAHYNRGMACNKLGVFNCGLLDGQQCIELDASWAKGYKCKAQALVGLKREKDGIESLVDGFKLCSKEDIDLHLMPLVFEVDSKLVGQAAVQAYKGERLSEAVLLFTAYIKKHADDKVSHYNREVAGQLNAAQRSGRVWD